MKIPDFTGWNPMVRIVTWTLDISLEYLSILLQNPHGFDILLTVIYIWCITIETHIQPLLYKQMLVVIYDTLLAINSLASLLIRTNYFIMRPGREGSLAWDGFQFLVSAGSLKWTGCGPFLIFLTHKSMYVCTYIQISYTTNMASLRFGGYQSNETT